MEAEGYVVIPGVVDKKAAELAVQAMEDRVRQALEGYGVQSPGDMTSLLGAAVRFDRTPPNWPGARFGGFAFRGWQKKIGVGRLFKDWDDPSVLACREATRYIVAHWHQSAGGSGVLTAMPEMCSVKPGGCPALPAHLDQGRVGTLQVLIALSATEVILWPRSRKIPFNEGGSGRLAPCPSTFLLFDQLLGLLLLWIVSLLVGIL